MINGFGFSPLLSAIRRLRLRAISLSLASLACNVLYNTSSSWSLLPSSLQQSRKMMTKVTIAKTPEPQIPYNLSAWSVVVSNHIYKIRNKNQESMTIYPWRNRVPIK